MLPLRRDNSLHMSNTTTTHLAGFVRNFDRGSKPTTSVGIREACESFRRLHVVRSLAKPPAVEAEINLQI